MSGSRIAREDAHLPAVGRVAGDLERTLVERLAVVEELREVNVVDRTHTLAPRAHAALVDDVAHHDPFTLALVRGHCATRLPSRDVEREGGRGSDVRLAEPAPQHAQHRVGVRDGADRRAGVGTHPLLVDDDRGRQPFEDVDLGPGQRRHESLHERAVGLVDQPLRLGRDGAEHQRRLARTRDAGEHRQPPLGDLDADVLEVVLPGALDTDQVVAVCWRSAFAQWRRAGGLEEVLFAIMSSSIGRAVARGATLARLPRLTDIIGGHYRLTRRRARSGATGDGTDVGPPGRCSPDQSSLERRLAVGTESPTRSESEPPSALRARRRRSVPARHELFGVSGHRSGDVRQRRCRALDCGPHGLPDSRLHAIRMIQSSPFGGQSSRRGACCRFFRKLYS